MNEKRSSYHRPDSLTGGLGLFCKPFHREMVADCSRVTPFKEAISSAAHGQVVFESGTGTGIMSIFAARAGAKCVYASEIDPKMVKLSRANVAQNDLDDRVQILSKRTEDVSLDDLGGTSPDLFIVENLGSWLVTEPQLVITNYLTKHLAHANSTFLPLGIKNLASLGESQFLFDGVEVRSYYVEFTGISSPRRLSRDRLAREMLFFADNALEFQDTIFFEVEAAGTLNSVRLTNELLLAPGIVFKGSDTLLPPVVIPLTQDLLVRPGDRIQLVLSYKSFDSWDNFQVRAKLVV